MKKLLLPMACVMFLGVQGIANQRPVGFVFDDRTSGAADQRLGDGESFAGFECRFRGADLQTEAITDHNGIIGHVLTLRVNHRTEVPLVSGHPIGFFA